MIKIHFYNELMFVHNDAMNYSNKERYAVRWNDKMVGKLMSICFIPSRGDKVTMNVGSIGQSTGIRFNIENNKELNVIDLKPVLEKLHARSVHTKNRHSVLVDKFPNTNAIALYLVEHADILAKYDIKVIPPTK